MIDRIDQNKPPLIPGALCGIFSGANVQMTRIPEMGVGLVGRSYSDGDWAVVFETGHFGYYTSEVLSLLVNSPLAMCHGARWLVVKLGGDPGTTAPPWFYDADTSAWMLHGMKTTFFFYGDLEGKKRCFGRGRLVPDIHKVLDPAEALAAACAVVGAA